MNKIKFLLSFLAAAYLSSCSYDKPELKPDTGYPEDVANILVRKCATQGCHNALSRSTSAGLDFSTWEVMFDGGRNGSSVIPYSADYSFMLYTVNTDTNKGPVLLPTMPYLLEPLSENEYDILKNWIANGAPDKSGSVMFANDPLRKKVYICMQGCDKVAVIDAASKVIMRYIDVGSLPNQIESPHLIRVSPDGQFWYVVFYAGSVLQKFRCSDDKLVATLDIGGGQWNTIMISPDGKKGFVNNTAGNLTKVVNLETMTFPQFPDQTFDYPHGGFITADGHYLYLSSQTGNFINKVDLTDSIFYSSEKITLVPGSFPSTSSSLDPHEIFSSPDGTKYFVSCQKTNEVRVFHTSNDSLLKIIPVGEKPQEFDVSSTHPYLFVTCTEAQVNASQRGLVYVINYNDFNIVTTIYTGYQPHGIAVDDAEDLVYVANLNYDSNAPAPHHVTACGGKNGNLSIINMNTLQMYRKTLSDGSNFQYKNELLSFPYFVSLRK